MDETAEDLEPADRTLEIWNSHERLKHALIQDDEAWATNELQLIERLRSGEASGEADSTPPHGKLEVLTAVPRLSAEVRLSRVVGPDRESWLVDDSDVASWARGAIAFRSIAPDASPSGYLNLVTEGLYRNAQRRVADMAKVEQERITFLENEERRLEVRMKQTRRILVRSTTRSILNGSILAIAGVAEALLLHIALQRELDLVADRFVPSYLSVSAAVAATVMLACLVETCRRLFLVSQLALDDEPLNAQPYRLLRRARYSLGALVAVGLTLAVLVARAKGSTTGLLFAAVLAGSAVSVILDWSGRETNPDFMDRDSTRDRLVRYDVELMSLREQRDLSSQRMQAEIDAIRDDLRRTQVAFAEAGLRNGLYSEEDVAGFLSAMPSLRLPDWVGAE